MLGVFNTSFSSSIITAVFSFYIWFFYFFKFAFENPHRYILYINLNIFFLVDILCSLTGQITFPFFFLNLDRKSSALDMGIG